VLANCFVTRSQPNVATIVKPRTSLVPILSIDDDGADCIPWASRAFKTTPKRPPGAPWPRAATRYQPRIARMNTDLTSANARSSAFSCLRRDDSVRFVGRRGGIRVYP
jgi:hypothetical protein